MSEPISPGDLRVVLDRATDAVEAPGLAAGSLAEARRRRARSRGVASAVVAAAAVAGLVVAAQAVTGDPRTQEPPADPASSGAAEVRVAPAIPADRVQPLWDPRGAEGLPVLELGMPRVLPVTDTGPVARAVALLDGPAGTVLVGPDGAQTDLPVPVGLSGQHTTVLSPDGRRVVAVGLGGFYWREVDGGEWQRVEVLDVDLESAVAWAAGSDAVVLQHHRGGVRVDLTTGEQEALPFLRGGAPYGLAPDGAVVHGPGAWSGEVVERHDGSVVRRTRTGPLEGLARPVVGESAIAFARADVVHDQPARATDRDGLVVVDRDTFATRAYLPVPDDHDYYVHADELRATAWLDDDTLLVTVLPQGAPKEYLVAWDVDTGTLSRVACWPLEYAASFATDLLER